VRDGRLAYSFERVLRVLDFLRRLGGLDVYEEEDAVRSLDGRFVDAGES
jgi:hypothetical protein